MRILMQNRLDAFKNKGGDTVQMLRTKEYLEKLGVEVDISLELEPDLKKYDIVHLFNISRVDETWIQFKNAKKQYKKIVVSTIYHSKSQIREYEKYGLYGIGGKFIKLMKNENNIEVFKTLIRTIYSSRNFKPFLNQFKTGYAEQQKYIVKNADTILPNSEMELSFISKELGINLNDINYSVVPNGVDLITENKDTTEKLFTNKYGYKNFIFCVGRIEPLKNQIRLIESLKYTNEIIIFAGAINKKHIGYYKKFKKLIKNNPNLIYLGVLEKDILNSAYKAAKLTILPSWFETTGLVGLESISCGTNIIITDRGYTKNYYKNYVKYCNPKNLYDITENINKLSMDDCSYEIIDEINTKFNWEKCAVITKKVYEHLLLGGDKH